MKTKLTPYYRGKRITAYERANSAPGVQGYVRVALNPRCLRTRYHGFHNRGKNKNWQERRGKKYREHKRVEHCLELEVKYVGERSRGVNLSWEIEDQYPDIRFRESEKRSPSHEMGTIRIVWYADEQHSGIADEIMRMHLGRLAWAIEVLSITYNGKSLKIEQEGGHKHTKRKSQFLVLS